MIDWKEKLSFNDRRQTHDFNNGRTAPLLIFVHIPKTAGSTFTSILTAIYRLQVCSIYSVDEIDRFKTFPQAQHNIYQLIQGHFPYGIHAWIQRPVRYITFLRDPVARVISLYRHFQRHPGSYLHHKVNSESITLEEFVDSRLTAEIYNFQTRMIAGTKNLEPLFPEPDETTLALAKQRLEKDFTAFGLTEYFDQSLVMSSPAVGWRLLSSEMFYTNRNVAPKPASSLTIAPDTIETIRKNNQLDIELYTYAQDLFKARWAADPRHRLQLQLYRWARRLWQKYNPVPA